MLHQKVKYFNFVDLLTFRRFIYPSSTFLLSHFQGVWPYTYNSCDVGTLPNQTNPGGLTPTAAKTTGDPAYGGELSWVSISIYFFRYFIFLFLEYRRSIESSIELISFKL